MIDHESHPGAWAKALQAPCSYRTITEHPGATHPFPLRRETDGAASHNPDAVPSFCAVYIHNGGNTRG